ncbi:hypothetical protein BZG36_02100 [Bifiguratus adelaidae]|uniref:GH16 domain-containing protein n=1 Tax=Bifiguratus adelaidae TaxID=1938954 RepID=A0A261Y366_9FUNG|nr:hypothetical protein BZG36_02100 [Bifiguratus adelaidae]
MADGTDPMSLGFYDAWCGKNTAVQGGALKLSLTQECGPNIATSQAFTNSRVDIELQTASYTSGVVTALSFIGASSPKDEMDLEWVGTNPNQVQTMYFVQGQRVEGALGAWEFATAGAASSTQTYSFIYSDNQMQWLINNKVVRTVNKGSGPFPSQALQLHLGVWDGSDYSSWAGTTDWSKATNGVFNAYVKSIKMQSLGCNASSANSSSSSGSHQSSSPSVSSSSSSVSFTSSVPAPSPATTTYSTTSSSSAHASPTLASSSANASFTPSSSAAASSVSSAPSQSALQLHQSGASSLSGWSHGCALLSALVVVLASSLMA